jgi:hypothetical protein
MFVARNARINPLQTAENNAVGKCNGKGIDDIKSNAEVS